MAGKCWSNASSKRHLRKALRGVMGAAYLDLGQGLAQDNDIVGFVKDLL